MREYLYLGAFFDGLIPASAGLADSLLTEWEVTEAARNEARASRLLPHADATELGHTRDAGITVFVLDSLISHRSELRRRCNADRL